MSKLIGCLTVKIGSVRLLLHKASATRERAANGQLSPTHRSSSNQRKSCKWPATEN